MAVLEALLSSSILCVKVAAVYRCKPATILILIKRKQIKLFGKAWGRLDPPINSRN